MQEKLVFLLQQLKIKLIEKLQIRLKVFVSSGEVHHWPSIAQKPSGWSSDPARHSELSHALKFEIFALT